MHRLNTCSVCLGGRSDILVPEQLFLKFVLNFQGIGFVTWLVLRKKPVLGKGYSPGGFCWFGDCLDLWFLPGLATVVLSSSWLWDSPETDDFPSPVQQMQAGILLSALLFPLLTRRQLSFRSRARGFIS